MNNTTSRIFSILAVAPTTPTRPFDIISAKLSNGSLGQSNLIVTYPASTERGLPRILAPTAPYPVRNNSWVTFGAAFGNGGDPVTVTSFDIEIPGGYDMDHNGGRGAPLFAEIHPTERVPASGSWTILDGGRLIHWEGLAEVAQGSAAQFYAKVRITPDLQYATAIEPAWSNGPNATLTFDNGYFQSSTSWGKSPGIIRMQVPPASRATDDPQGGTLDGYPWSLAGRPVGEVRTIETKSNSVLAHLSNTTTYRLSPSAADAVALENALGNATFEMEDRLVRVGTEARVYADIESLVELVHGSGATGALTIDMYAPPSLFCAPTRSYQYNTLDLPRSAISAALLWQDGAVAPGFYVATEDGAVHRVEMTGFTAWSSSVSAGPTILKKMDLGLAGKYVVVGTNAGRVHAFDAADGTAQDRIATLDGAKLAPITAITIDPAGPWIYAADANGTVVVLDKDLHEHARASYGPSIRDIIVHGAHIYIHNATHLARLSGMLQEERSVLAEGPGFVRGRDWVYFAHPTMLARIDPLTLETVELDALDGTAHLTARGDATGDGIDDLIVGISGQRIRVIDGASESGVRAYNDIILDDPLIPRPDVSTLPELTGGIRDQPSATLSTAPLCEPRVVPAAYGTPVACTLSEGPGLIRAVAANGGLVVDVISNGLESVRRYGNDGHAQGIWWYTEGTTPRALDIGTMLTSSRAMIIGDSVGTATLYDDMGTPLVESTPSDRVGRFVFTTHIPEGGFFGTHLVVARLAWGAGVEPMEARLVEWFEAVAPDGSPVQRPAYRAALTIDDHMPTS